METIDQTEAVKLWKEHKVDTAYFEFSCGGDSMNETTFTLFDDKGKKMKDTSDLERLLEDLVYDNVNFYEASDGHYQGETGTVYINLDDDEETLSFSKSSKAEYNEMFTEVGYFQLTEKEAAFLKEFVSSISHDDFGGKADIRYKKDLVITDERFKLLDKFLHKLHEFAEDLEIKEANGEQQEFLQYYTGGDIGEENSIQITKENKLIITVSRNYTVYQENELP